MTLLHNFEFCGEEWAGMVFCTRVCGFTLCWLRSLVLPMVIYMATPSNQEVSYPKLDLITISLLSSHTNFSFSGVSSLTLLCHYYHSPFCPSKLQSGFLSNSPAETFSLFSQVIPSANLGFVNQHATEVEFTINGRDLVIHQSPTVLNSSRGGGTTGAG